MRRNTPLPKVYFGNRSIMTEGAWSAMPDDDPDDEELPTTPPDIVAMLGFDPKTENNH